MLNTTIFTKRLQELMQKHELTASRFADSIGIQRSSISHLLSGRNKPSLEFILKVLENYPDISFDWLVKGINIKKESDLAPTLFDTPPTDSGKRTAISDTTQEAVSSSFRIEKVIILYKDGSFREYDAKI